MTYPYSYFELYDFYPIMNCKQSFVSFYENILFWIQCDAMEQFFLCKRKHSVLNVEGKMTAKKAGV